MDERATKEAFTLLMARGLLTLEQVQEADRFAGELATRKMKGEITDEQAGALIMELALKHANQSRARRQT